MILMAKDLKPKFNSGFTILEITVVIGIMAVLLATAGLSIFISRRDNLILEQAGQDLVSEVRLAQSKILAVQRIEVEGEQPFTSKAVIIKAENGQNPLIYYLSSDCSSLKKAKTVDLSGSVNLSVPSSPVYLIYISPFAKFFAVSSQAAPVFINSTNNTCEPVEPVVTDDVNITLINGSKTYKIKIDKDSGGITIVQ